MSLGFLAIVTSIALLHQTNCCIIIIIIIMGSCNRKDALPAEF